MHKETNLNIYEDLDFPNMSLVNILWRNVIGWKLWNVYILKVSKIWNSSCEIDTCLYSLEIMKFWFWY